MYIKVIVELAAGVLLCNQSVWVMVSIVELDKFVREAMRGPTKGLGTKFMSRVWA